MIVTGKEKRGRLRSPLNNFVIFNLNPTFHYANVLYNPCATTTAATAHIAIVIPPLKSDIYVFFVRSFLDLRIALLGGFVKFSFFMIA